MPLTVVLLSLTVYTDAKRISGITLRRCKRGNFYLSGRLHRNSIDKCIGSKTVKI